MSGSRYCPEPGANRPVPFHRDRARSGPHHYEAHFALALTSSRMIRKLLKTGRQQFDTPEVQVSLAGGVPYLVNWSGRTYSVKRVIESWTAPEPSGESGQEREYVRVLTSDGELLMYRSGRSWYLDAVSVDSEGGEVLGIDPIERVAGAIRELQKREVVPEPESKRTRKRYSIKVIVPFTRK